MFCSIRVWSLVASKDLFRLSFILFLFGSFRFKLETSSVRSYCFVPDNWRDIILNHFDSINCKYLLKLLFYSLSYNSLRENNCCNNVLFYFNAKYSYVILCFIVPLYLFLFATSKLVVIF